MIKKAEKNALIGILIFRFIAGYADALTIIFYNEMMSAQTGRLTRLFVGLFNSDIDILVDSAVVLAAFFLGCIISGIIFPNDKFRFRLRYGLVELFTGIIFLFLSLTKSSPYIMYFIALSLGIQNGMLTYYRGIRVRTTILSGHVTSLGENIGNIISKRAKINWKTRFYFQNILYFGLGSALFMILTLFTKVNTVFVLAIIHLISALLFMRNNYNFENVDIGNYEEILD